MVTCYMMIFAVKKIKKIRLYQRFGYRLSEIAKLEYMTVDEQVMILKEKD